jgi:hypothetical protein
LCRDPSLWSWKVRMCDDALLRGGALGLVLLVVAGALLLAVCITEAAFGDPTQFVIVHTNNVNGHLFGCPT